MTDNDAAILRVQAIIDEFGAEGCAEIRDDDAPALRTILAANKRMREIIAELRTEWAFQYVSCGVTETSLVCESREEAEHESGRHRRGDRIVHRLCGEWETVEAGPDAAPTLRPLTPGALGYACARCGSLFTGSGEPRDEHSRHADSPYCRGCVDQCHEGSDGHRCVICTATNEGTAR